MPRRNPDLEGVESVGSNMTEVLHGRMKILYSYRTPVALLFAGGLYKTEKFHSNTTSRHISKWFTSYGLDPKGAKKLPQEIIEKLAKEGTSKGLTEEERAGSGLFEQNPPGERDAFGFNLGRANTGTYIDGAFGLDHAMQTMAGLLQRVVRATGDTQAVELLKEYDDDEIDEEFEGEWLDDATDVLQDNTAAGLVWEWEAGDLILMTEEEAE